MEDDRREPGECVRPPALDDLALISAIDGEIDVDTIAHLQICPYCARRAREFTDLHRLLSKQLYRALCPSSDELVAFQQGWLESGRRAELRDHLSACPHCAADMHLLVEAASGPLLAPPTPLARLRRIVAELLTPSPLAPLTSAYGALRGPSPGSQSTKLAPREFK